MHITTKAVEEQPLPKTESLSCSTKYNWYSLPFSELFNSDIIYIYIHVYIFIYIYWPASEILTGDVNRDSRYIICDRL